MLSVGAFNRAVAWPVRMVLVCVAGLGLAGAAVYAARFSPGIYFKVNGSSPYCPWPRVLSFYRDAMDLAERNQSKRASLAVIADDPAQKLARVRFSDRPRIFYISYEENGLEAELDLLAYLVADHDWVAALHPDHTVQTGDLVLDCGAHAGVFTSLALEFGATRVISVEPHPVRAECLRRTFSSEIAAGRVVVQEAAVWSSSGSMRLQLSHNDNSGTARLTNDAATDRPQPAVVTTTIDLLAQEFGHFDYIKMDIEGAEREALAGARKTLHRWRPRLMLDSYHHRDDARVLPAIARDAYPHYSETCGPCVSDGERLMPHVIFLR
jgi:FkbM family methyltransferase